MKKKSGHNWKFVQTSGLVQVQINTIDDVLNLRELDPKLWTALACPVKGLEFPEETLEILDEDKNGRVRVNEVLEAVDYIKKYFKKPEIIMEEGDTIPLDAFGDEVFDCGHSPAVSAKAVLEILGKADAQELSIDDINANDKLVSPGVLNGDGVITADCIKDEFSAGVVNDIIAVTGGADDISGVKGIIRSQKEEFFSQIRALKEWREAAVADDPKIFFLKEYTDVAAQSYLKIKDKINDYFLRCSLIRYDNSAQDILKSQADSLFTGEDGQISDLETLRKMPLALPQSEKPLPLDSSVNPAWCSEITDFKQNVIQPVFQKDIAALQEVHWRKLEELFAPYINWYNARPQNSADSITLDRIIEILSSNAETVLADYLDQEEAYPPVASASVELKKMLLLRRDFLTLLKNFVSFTDFYNLEKKAIFQAGTLFIDGRSCELCFKVLDTAKHGTMSPLSQCYLMYCDCTNRANTEEKMQIAALLSAGTTDNLIVGRNGVFYDRNNQEWDATIVKIVDNPISVKQAFWNPYKKMLKFIQEKLAKRAADAENKVSEKMTAVVDNPKDAASVIPDKKDIGVGTIAAISVAFTGIATVIGGILEKFFGLGRWIPLGIIGIILLISLPSMIIAWSKLRKRNIAPMLDASGWAINGNVKISTVFGSSLTHTPSRPVRAFISRKDPYAAKRFPVKRTLAALILLAGLIAFVVSGIRITFPKTCSNIGTFVTKTVPEWVMHNLGLEEKSADGDAVKIEIKDPS